MLKRNTIINNYPFRDQITSLSVQTVEEIHPKHAGERIIVQNNGPVHQLF